MIIICDYEYKLVKKYDSCNGISGKPSEIIALGKKTELNDFMKNNKMKNNDYVDYSYSIIRIKK